MTINYYAGTHHDGLLDAQGKLFKAIGILNTARLTTIPSAIEAAIAGFQLLADADTLEWQAVTEGLAAASTSWQSGGTSLAQILATACGTLVVRFVALDAPQPNNSLTTALTYLIEKMVADGYYVTANTVSLTLTPAGGNVGDVAILYSTRRGDGQVEQNLLPETLDLSVTSGGLTPSVNVVASAAVSDRLSQDWPSGSGINFSLAAVSPAASLLTNGSFETATFDANVPDGWIVVVGTPGTTILITVPEQQTVTIAGSPTGGTYQLQWADASGVVRSTAMLGYAAGPGAVQAALAQIPGLESVSVLSTGTSPNYTHAVIFTGCQGNPAQLTSVNHLTGGSPTITHATPLPGDAGAYQGRALKFASNGSELTTLYQRLPVLTADTVYFVHLRMKAAGTIAAGQVAIEIVDGVGGSVVNDAAGNAAQLLIAATAIGTTTHDSRWFSFRIPGSVSQPCYLRLRISTAIDSGASIYFDDVALVAGSQLYAGGPWVAAVGGRASSIPGDSWTLVAANNAAGGIQRWYNRAFGMADLGLLLPVSGAHLIPETVLS